MTCDLVDPAGPVVQILVHDLEPLEGAAQYTRITSTVLFLATQGLQVNLPQLKNLLSGVATANFLTSSTFHRFSSIKPPTLYSAGTGGAE